MPDNEFERLEYRGNFQVTCDLDFSESLLSARYPGGFREDVIIGSPNGLRTWRLTYANLNRDVLFKPTNGEPISREQYIWQFYARSKSGGNLPFIITCPLDRKDYLAIFTEDKLSYVLVDRRVRTTGLAIEQVFVKGVNTLEDGSLGEATNPDEI